MVVSLQLIRRYIGNKWKDDIRLGELVERSAVTPRSELVGGAIYFLFLFGMPKRVALA